MSIIDNFESLKCNNYIYFFGKFSQSIAIFNDLCIFGCEQ
jgi:hypothetical protein